MFPLITDNQADISVWEICQSIFYTPPQMMLINGIDLLYIPLLEEFNKILGGFERPAIDRQSDRFNCDMDCVINHLLSWLCEFIVEIYYKLFGVKCCHSLCGMWVIILWYACKARRWFTFMSASDVMRSCNITPSSSSHLNTIWNANKLWSLLCPLNEM